MNLEHQLDRHFECCALCGSVDPTGDCAAAALLQKDIESREDTPRLLGNRIVDFFKSINLSACGDCNRIAAEMNEKPLAELEESREIWIDKLESANRHDRRQVRLRNWSRSLIDKMTDKPIILDERKAVTFAIRQIYALAMWKEKNAPNQVP